MAAAGTAQDIQQTDVSGSCLHFLEETSNELMKVHPGTLLR